MALLEKTGAGSVLIAPIDGGHHLQTNHILDEDFAAQNPQQAEPVRSNGMRRYNNGLRLLSSMEMSEDGVRQFLSDRSESGAIWGMGEDGLYTDYAIMFLPRQKRSVVWTKRPSESPGQTFNL